MCVHKGKYLPLSRPKNVRSNAYAGQLRGQKEVVSSSLETLFRNLNSTRCPTSFKSHPFPTRPQPRQPQPQPTASKPLWRPLWLAKKNATTFLHSAFLDSRKRPFLVSEVFKQTFYISIHKCIKNPFFQMGIVQRCIYMHCIELNNGLILEKEGIMYFWDCYCY